MIIKLPTFRGYTFDFRCKQIRKVEWDELPEFIEMYSFEGEELLIEFFRDKQAVAELYNYLDKHHDEGFDMGWWLEQKGRVLILMLMASSEPLY